MRPPHELLNDDDDLAPPLLLDLEDVPAVTPTQPATKGSKRAPGPFEIGVVYRRGPAFFLAVSDRLLISMKGGAVQELRPITRYDAVRSISVSELCVTWGITLDQLDATVMRYLAPSQDAVKTRPRGSRRQRAADELKWRSRRTVRLLAG